MVTLRTGKPLLGIIMGVHRPDDSQVWISINSEPLFRGREALPYAVVTTFADITEQRRTDEDRRKAQANLTALVESTSDLIWSVDLEGRLLAYNQAAATVRYGGLRRASLRGSGARHLCSNRTAARLDGSLRPDARRPAHTGTSLF